MLCAEPKIVNFFFISMSYCFNNLLKEGMYTPLNPKFFALFKSLLKYIFLLFFLQKILRSSNV